MNRHAPQSQPEQPRLILLSQWFDPEPTFKGLIFAKAMQAHGYDVEVVTGFPNYPGGKLYDGYRIKLWEREEIDGVSVTRLPLYPSHDGRAIHRALNYISFCLTSLFYLTFIAQKADVLYAYHPPITVGLAAALAKLFRKTPSVLDIQDMWPDTLAATGMVERSWLLGGMSALCLWVYRRMSHIVVLSPGFKKLLIERGVPESKVSVIYNWADENALKLAGTVRPEPMPEDAGFRLLFAGNMGLAQNLDVVLDAAKIISTHSLGVEICFIGDGIETERLKQRTAKEQIVNIRFFPRVSMNEIGSYLASADALLVHLRPDPLFSITVPSKTQAYMCVGRPIIIAVDGDAATLVKNASAGLTVKPGDPQALSEAVIALSALTKAERQEIGRAAQKFYRANLALEIGVQNFVQVFDNVRRNCR